ncbi:hypothetical protein QYE76_035728 [Lolium multiflorum]|uniref:Reverse transcriptase domain-containing protein n=1 Tax=Lolium multiflorum TaxID=4521 RepID=A0AAD8R114_LOLMU|nr:hypothetical protein QYE76_035728 [Lolium multiflorum]
MSITLGAATKLLDDMMTNYSEWHTERAPQGKKVNSVEETSSLSDKIDAIMSMLVNGRSNVDPNNVPLASLVAQEEHVDVNFIKSNNFNNNAYRNNSGNNYRPYPSNNGNGYGNSYGNSYNNNRSVPPGLEAMLKEFISTQTAFNKSVEEKLDKIDILTSKVDRLASDVDLLKLKVMPNKDNDNKIVTTANAIQVRINENIRLMAELHARWEREENEKLAKENNVAKVWTITTTSNDNASHVATPPTINGKIIGVGNVSTPSAKRAKLPETAKTAQTACDKTAEIFQNIGDNDPIAVDHNGLDFYDCHISEVIKFLQKLARSPNASAINLAFTKHITNALIKAREEKLKLETSIPRKLEDGWEPIIKMRVNDFDCNALCDLGASISVMPKKIYDMLDLPPLKNCYLDVNLADNAIKKPLGRIDNVRIMVNNNLVPVDFVVLDIECNASCPIILGRPFLRTVGATIDMKEGIDKLIPCQLAPSVGSRGDKELISMAHSRSSTSSVASNIMERGKQIETGLIDFIPHPPSRLDAYAYLEEPMKMTFGKFHFRIEKEGAYRVEVPISSGLSAVGPDFSNSVSSIESNDKEISSPRFIGSRASEKLAKIFSDMSFESSADSYISDDSSDTDSFDFIDKSISIGKVFTNLYDGVTKPSKVKTPKYHQVYAIGEASRDQEETSEAFDDLGNPYVDPSDLRRGHLPEIQEKRCTTWPWQDVEPWEQRSQPHLPKELQGKIVRDLPQQCKIHQEQVEPETQQLMPELIERDKKEGNVGIHQNLLKRTCVDFHVSHDGSEKLEFHQDSSYPIVSRNSMDCKTLRIG